jgi:hypothetical protein
MPVYKIFPEKDAFISSEFPITNTGLDEILQLENYTDLGSTVQVSRILIKFPDHELQELLTGVLQEATYAAKLKLYLAEANNLPVTYTVEAAPIYLSGSIDWNQGTGKLGDLPNNSSGVSWVTASIAPTTEVWSQTLPAGVTSSYAQQVGGGTWYTGSYIGSQTHVVKSTHDLSIDVTTFLEGLASSELENKGLILKLDDSLEFNPNAAVRLKYFGSDTNTIYPPTLDIYWDDQVVDSTLPVLDTDLATISITNNKGTYRVDSKQRFRLTASPKYPARTFTTGSIYTANFKLPDSTLWALKDEHTEELIIDFDEIGTKLSSDTEGCYFDVFMNGLQPERYYRLLVKATIAGSDVIFSTEQPFKVVRSA